MSAAYEETQKALVVAYENQIIEQGGDPANIDVIISGLPDFAQNNVDPVVLGDFEFTSCVVSTR